MNRTDIIVIGTSAGGVEALSSLLANLPKDLDAAVFIVQHMSPHSISRLPEVLARRSALPVQAAINGAPIAKSRIYVACPDMHLLLRPGCMILRRSPHENRTRPAIDVLFRSAAVHYGPRVIGVVLTGLLDDGTEGLIAIKAAGGLSVVQDPEDAAWPSMPIHALERDHVDHMKPLAEIPALLGELARNPAATPGILPDNVITEDRIAGEEEISMTKTPGEASPLSCPSCGGVLNRIEDGDSIRFRCQIGHAFTSVALKMAQSDEMERALVIAARTHRERMRHFHDMEKSARLRNLKHAADRWKRAGEEAERLTSALDRALNLLAASEKPAA